ncbi:hypothetical protein [Streptomyces sp. NPDC047928]|uniref:hypothetical protein n=1 Tax=unclassified Streptomyces TaxID=2593676 RepID=UPI00371AC2D1
MTADPRPGTELFVLWHARHLVREEDGRTIHRDADGAMHLDEEEWRILGVYTAKEAAQAQRDKASTLPGFRDEPECFDISPLVLDEDLWTDGYFTEYPDGSTQD